MIKNIIIQLKSAEDPKTPPEYRVDFPDEILVSDLIYIFSDLLDRLTVQKIKQQEGLQVIEKEEVEDVLN